MNFGTARAGELRALGIPAAALAVELGPETWHVIVQRADGAEDPSSALGMESV